MQLGKGVQCSVLRGYSMVRGCTATYYRTTHYTTTGAHDEEHAGLAEVVKVEEAEALVRAL